VRVIDPDDFARGFSPPPGIRPQWNSKTSEENFTLELRFNVSANATDLALNQSIVEFAASVGSQLPIAMGLAFRQAGNALLSAQVRGMPIQSLIENRELIPWLPWSDRVVAGSQPNDFARLASERFPWRLDRRLAGQKLLDITVPLGDIFVARKAERDGEALFGFTLLDLELTSIAFEAGSIKSIWKGVGKSLASVSFLLSLTYVEPQVTKIINHETAIYQAHEVVAKVMSGQNDPFCAARLSFKELEDARERSLNYREAGISIEERQCRTAQGQALLAVALNIDLDIDGVAGNQTHEAERAFAHMHNLPCTDCPEFRGRLAQVIDDLIAKKEGLSKE